MSIRTAGIVIIGNEILGGAVQDENVHFISRRFHELGVRVDKIVIVGDDIKDIADEVNDFVKTFDLVITSGGVGPTHDDVTYEGIAKALDVDLELNEELLDYWSNDPLENEESAKKMSIVPKLSKILYAKLSEQERTPVVVVSNVYVFPGTPKLLRSRFTALEQQHFHGNGIKFHKREIYLSVDETNVISELNETVNTFKDVAIGSYPDIDNNHYCTRLTLHSHEEHRVIEAYNMLISLIKPSWIVNISDLSNNVR